MEPGVYVRFSRAGTYCPLSAPNASMLSTHREVALSQPNRRPLNRCLCDLI